MPVASRQVLTYASAAHFDAPQGEIGAGGQSSGVGIGARSPYSAPPVDVKTTSAPWRLAAIRTFSVPSTLTSQSRCGSATETVTLDWAARWRIAAGRTASISRSSATRSLISTTARRAWAVTLSAEPVERSSITTTSAPVRSAASTTWEPMNPAPPVTTIVELVALASGSTGARMLAGPPSLTRYTRPRPGSLTPVDAPIRDAELAGADDPGRPGTASVGGRAASASGMRFPHVAAITSLGVMLCAVIDALSRATMAPSIWFFWLGIAAIVAPVLYRLCAADASAFERVSLVCLLGLSLYAIKMMREPFGYTMPDEFFHAHNAAQIAATHRLFGSDSMLPISTKYPGLEGATSALMLMTGMSSFGAGLIVIAAARTMLMVALFVLFSKLSGSPRVAGLGAAIYAGNSNFLYFDAMFSYESLALALLAVVLAGLALRSDAGAAARREWTLPLLLAIAGI